MKGIALFLIGAFVSFALTYSVFAAASDEGGTEHWIAQQTSALAALAGRHG